MLVILSGSEPAEDTEDTPGEGGRRIRHPRGYTGE